MALLKPAELQESLRKVPRWELAGDAIRRTFVFPDFPSAVAFVVHVGFASEAADHHPDIAINYKKVTLSFSTHSEGGLTAKDFAGARAADEIGRDR